MQIYIDICICVYIYYIGLVFMCVYAVCMRVVGVVDMI